LDKTDRFGVAAPPVAGSRQVHFLVVVGEVTAKVVITAREATEAIAKGVTTAKVVIVLPIG
jgi:hypothetical protein